MAGQARRRRLRQDHLAEGSRRPRRHADPAGHLQSGRSQVRRADRLLRHRPRHVHPDADDLRQAGGSQALREAGAARPGDLVPALFRAGRRLRRRGPAHAGRARRRWLGDQRPEGLDLRRALLGLRHPADPHRSVRAQAQGPDDVLHRHEGPGCRREADQADQRRRELQRGLFHRPAGEGQPAPRRGRRRLEGGAHHADARASGGRRRRRRQRAGLQGTARTRPRHRA